MNRAFLFNITAALAFALALTGCGQVPAEPEVPASVEQSSSVQAETQVEAPLEVGAFAQEEQVASVSELDYDALRTANLTNWGQLAVSSDWVYYVNWQKGAICRCREDGSENELIYRIGDVEAYGIPVSSLMVEGERLYFCLGGTRIISIKQDGTDEKLLYQLSSPDLPMLYEPQTPMAIYNGRLYFPESGWIWSIPLDGGDPKAEIELRERHPMHTPVQFSSDSVYWELSVDAGNPAGGVHKMRAALDGSSVEEVWSRYSTLYLNEAEAFTTQYSNGICSIETPDGRPVVSFSCNANPKESDPLFGLEDVLLYDGTIYVLDGHYYEDGSGIARRLYRIDGASADNPAEFYGVDEGGFLSPNATNASGATATLLLETSKDAHSETNALLYKTKDGAGVMWTFGQSHLYLVNDVTGEAHEVGRPAEKPLSPDELHAAYQPIVEAYAQAADGGDVYAAMDATRSVALSEYLLHGAKPIEYLLYDIDENGTEELLVSLGGHLEIYDIESGSARQLASEVMRGHVKVLEDGYIVTGGSGGADSHGEELFKYRDGELIQVGGWTAQAGVFMYTNEEEGVYGEVRSEYDFDIFTRLHPELTLDGWQDVHDF